MNYARQMMIPMYINKKMMDVIHTMKYALFVLQKHLSKIPN